MGALPYPTTSLMADYLDILKEWEQTTANGVIYENIDSLFPAYAFRKIQDRWVSPLKMDLSKPKTPNKEKTVVGRDLKFREQGEWSNPVNVQDKLMCDYNLGSVFEVYKFIADRFCLDMPTTSDITAGPGSRTNRQRVLAALEQYFTWNLENNSGAACREVRRYLSEIRGFTPEWQKKLGFGFVPSWEKVESYITSPRIRISKDELEDACSVKSEDGYTTVGKFHTLAIPYRCGGELRGFIFRAVGDFNPKYKASKGLERKTVFFNMPENRDRKEIIVVEGEMDALTATAAGVANVVAIGGSEISSERRSQVYDAFNRNTRKITLCLDLDTDSEGRPNEEKHMKAVRRSLHAIFDIMPDFNEVYVAHFPTPSDPDEYIRANGAAAFCRLISEAQPWFRFLDEQLSK